MMIGNLRANVFEFLLYPFLSLERKYYNEIRPTEQSF